MHYYEKNFKQEQIENNEVLSKISNELKDSLLIEYNKQILNKIDFLSEKFSQETLNELSLYFVEEYYFPNQVIYFEKDTKDQSLMFIVEGQVELVYFSDGDHKQQIKIEKLQSGEIFGQFSFFTGLSRQTSARSTEFTKIMKLNRQDLIEIIQKRDNEYQKFCETKDKILMYNRYGDTNLKCKICNMNTHLIQNCSNLQLNKQAILIKTGMMEQDQQKRKTYKRKGTYNKNPLSIYRIQKDLIRFLVERLEEENILQRQTRSDYVSSIDNSQMNSDDDDLKVGIDDTYSGTMSSEKHEKKQIEDQPDQDSEHSHIKGELLNNKTKISTHNSKINPHSINEFEQEFINGYESKKTKGEQNSQIQNIHSSDCNVKTSQLEAYNQQDSQKKHRDKSDKYNLMNNHPSEGNNLDDKQDSFLGSGNLNKKLSFNQNSLTKKSKIKVNQKVSSNESLQMLNQTQGSFSDRKKQAIKDFFNSIMEKDQYILKTHSVISNVTHRVQFSEFNQWGFDQMKDYEFYFPYNNPKILLLKYSRVKLSKRKLIKKLQKSDQNGKKW